MNCFVISSLLRVASRRSLALVLAFLLGFIFLNPALLAETIVIPDPSRTNQFTTVESWVELNYSTNVICLTWDEFDDYYWPNIMGECNWIREQCESYFWNVYYTGENIDQYLRDFEDNADWPDDFSDQFAQDWENLVTSINWEYRGFQSQAYDFLAEVTNSVTIIESTMVELSNLETNVISSVTFGQEYGRSVPGGCECPDYTQYLTYIAACLTQIQQAIDKWDGYLTAFRNGLLSVFSSDQDIGEAFAGVLKALADFQLGSDDLLSLADSSMSDFGSRLTELLLCLSYVQRADQSSLSSHVVSSNLYAHLIDGWVYPTNTSDRPLFVQLDEDTFSTLLSSILAQAEMSVSVTNGLNVTNNVEVHVSVTNEIENINNNIVEIDQFGEDLNENLDPVNEITETIEDRTSLFDGWDRDIARFPTKFQSLWNSEFTCPEALTILDGYDAIVPNSIMSGGWGNTRRRDQNGESVLQISTLQIYIGPNADTASGRWIYKIASLVHDVTNVFWALLMGAILVRLFYVDLFLLRCSCVIFLSWLSMMGVGGMQKITIGEAYDQVISRIGDVYGSMFGGDGD